jgi:hypothetical protein
MAEGPPNFQAFLRRYDLSGDETRTRQVLAPDVAFPSGICLAGHLGFGNKEVFLRKYDDGGLELWSRRLRTSENGDHLTAG